MISTPLLRWGTILSVLTAVALAVALRMQHQQPILDSSPTEPTTYCYNRVRTQDKAQKSARCFTVQDGVFTRVWGANKKDPATLSATAHIVDGYVIPGLWDGHGHLMAYGEFLHSVDLFGSKSFDEVRDRIKTYLQSNPDAGTKDQWLRGVGWDQDAFGRMPTAVSYFPLLHHLLCVMLSVLLTSITCTGGY